MLIIVLILGMWFHESEATPPFNVNPTSETGVPPEYRLEQIQQLKSIEWTTSSDHQDTLWTWYWTSRLGLRYDDPDIFERIVNIQKELATQNSEELLRNLVQSRIIVNVAWDILGEEYDLTPDMLPARIHQRIQEQLSESIVLFADNDVEEWMECWKSSGGSVGVELFRGVLQSIHSELTTSGNASPSVERLYESWGLHKTPDASCPEFQPGQAFGQPIPKEPEPNLQVLTDSGTRTPTLEVLIGTCAIGILWLLYKRRRKILFQLLLPCMLLWILEWTAGFIVTPLITREPMFQITDWSVEPWSATETALITQGDYLRAQRIPKSTTRNRLVILGASSAHGSNELAEDSFAGIIQQGSNWEVVNLGIGGTTSAGLVALIPYIESLNPDALVILYGHNELYQLRKLNQFQSTPLQILRIQRLFWSSNLYSLLHKALNTHQATRNDETVPTSSPLSEEALLEVAEMHFCANMSLLLERFKDVPTLLLSPPTNYPFAPMEYIPALPNDRDAIQKRIDAHFEATTIHSAIRSQISKLAAQYQTTYWDLDEHFHLNSPDGISANGLFWDELHPSALGHQWIARGVETWLSDL